MISGITDNVAAGRSVNYTLDALYRLAQAVTTGDSTYPQWGLAENNCAGPKSRSLSKSL